MKRIIGRMTRNRELRNRIKLLVIINIRFKFPNMDAVNWRSSGRVLIAYVIINGTCLRIRGIITPLKRIIVVLVRNLLVIRAWVPNVCMRKWQKVFPRMAHFILGALITRSLLRQFNVGRIAKLLVTIYMLKRKFFRVIGRLVAISGELVRPRNPFPMEITFCNFIFYRRT